VRVAAAAALMLLTACTREKHLIEFGWDEPDTAFLRRHIEAMERTPFDGCVFRVEYRTPSGERGKLNWKTWGRRAFERADIAPAIADLRATERKRFNRLFLRVNVTPGDVDWFDDFTPVLANLRLAAEAAREGRCRGLLFDTEPYESPLFDYKRQRHAAQRSWKEYAAQARLRGAEVMRAFQQGFPDVEILLTFGYTLPWWETQDGRRPLSEGHYGLLAPFLDGMVDAAQGARLVDGYELSYAYKEPRQFWAAYDLARRGVAPIVADPDRYRRVTTVGFGLWMDYDWRRHGWDGIAYDRNYFSPDAFERSLRAAWETTSDYVWVYTEQPRWWTPEGGSAKLPAAYVSAVRRVREGTR
jgi:hypothetical protein